MQDHDSEVQSALDAGLTPDHPDARSYQGLFQVLNKESGPGLPGGFAFRVMDRIITIRLRSAEQQARRAALFATVLLIAAAALGVLVSMQFGWMTGAWLTRLPLAHLTAAGAGLLLLVGLDFLFETRLQSTNRQTT